MGKASSVLAAVDIRICKRSLSWASCLHPALVSQEDVLWCCHLFLRSADEITPRQLKYRAELSVLCLNCCTSDMFPTLSAAAHSANLISFFPLCAAGAKSWSTARTCPRSPLSSSSSTKRSRSSCGRCTVLSITRRPTCWRRSSSWMTTVMRVSAGVWGTSTGGVLISSRLRFAFLRSHAALRCVSFGCGDAAGSLQSDRVVLPLFCFFSFCSKNWNRIKPKLKSAITTDWNCN